MTTMFSMTPPSKGFLLLILPAREISAVAVSTTATLRKIKVFFNTVMGYASIDASKYKNNEYDY
ncbi:MAG: hypothetical protein KZQ64_12930 [gamma proteobacterium symbiont of Bathyaustriella thionipta]|nr:hypothetical protein [gamma proteobacterium symbiont of Bathyaustriella thionipta]MCU7954275.1 hypothetical protein [gamma proteobacterium symbiont of Bathyaustriella thionipta]